jgi:hypothetical protein
MSSTRNAYHTHIKFLAREKLLSSVVIQQIPRSNIYRWRKELPGKYHDFGLASSANQEYEQ